MVQRIIEEIRECIASRLWHLVVVKADLIEHLRSIKDYFLLAKGEFYQTFLEESRSIMSLPPQNSAEYDINIGPLQQTIIKLSLEEDTHLKKFKLKLRSFSFNYNNFSTRNGLVCVGDVNIEQLSKNNYALRIRSTKNSRKSGCLWHALKQRIDMGFKTTFGFRFRNPLVHDTRGGAGVHGGVMNASIISGSVLGSPSKASHRNNIPDHHNNSLYTPMRVTTSIY